MAATDEFAGMDATALRARAASAHAAAVESFERCDTDGFLSQWASDITGRKASLQADIVEAGGLWEFPALFSADGELVAAKMVSTRYGISWALLEDDSPSARFVGWFNSSRARSNDRRIAANLKKGYRLGRVLAPARADIGGSGHGLSGATSCYVYAKRTDGGFSRSVTVVSIEGLIGEPSFGLDD